MAFIQKLKILGPKILLPSLLIVSFLIFFSSLGFAGEDEKNKDWYGEAYLYVWGPQIDTDISVAGRSVDGDIKLKDILKSLDGMFMGHGEVGYKRFGILVDGVYLKTTSHKPGPLGVGDNKVGLKFGIVDTGLTYLIFGKSPLQTKGWSMAFDAFVGARIFDVKVQSDTTNAILNTHLAGGDTWADPLLGLRFRSDIVRNLYFFGHGEIGGFGANSDLTWSAEGGLGYGFWRTLVIYLSYKALGVDFQNDKGGNEQLDLNLLIHGPLFGIGLNF